MLPEEQKRVLRLMATDSQIIDFARSLGLTVADVDEALGQILRKVAFNNAIIGLRQLSGKGQVARLAKDVQKLRKRSVYVFTVATAAAVVMSFVGITGYGLVGTWLNNLAEATKEARSTAAELRTYTSDLIERGEQIVDRTDAALKKQDEEHTKWRDQVGKDIKDLQETLHKRDKERAERRTRQLIAQLMVEADSVMDSTGVGSYPDPTQARKAIQLSRLSFHKDLREGDEAESAFAPTIASLDRLFTVVDNLMILKDRAKLRPEQVIEVVDNLEDNAQPIDRVLHDFARFDQFVESGQYKDRFSERAAAYFHYALAHAKVIRYHNTDQFDTRLLDDAKAHYNSGAGISTSLRWLCLLQSGGMSAHLAESTRPKNDNDKIQLYEDARREWTVALPYSVTDLQKARIANNLAHIDLQEFILLTPPKKRDRLESAWAHINNARKLQPSLVEAEGTWAQIYCLRIDNDHKLGTLEAWDEIVNAIRSAEKRGIFQNYTLKDFSKTAHVFDVLTRADIFAPDPNEKERVEQFNQRKSKFEQDLKALRNRLSAATED